MRRMAAFLLVAVVGSAAWHAGSCRAGDGAYDYDVTIIGAGAGGLSAGATLARGGKRVAVFEQHDKVGGYMTAFSREPYNFEVSLHAIDGVREGTVFYDILEELDLLSRVTFIPLDPLYRCVFPDQTLDVPANRLAFLGLLSARFPHEREGIEKFFRTARKAGDEVTALSRLEERNPLVRYASYLVFPLKFPTLLKYRKATLEEILDDHVEDERLRAVLAQLSGYLGLPPSRVSGLYYLIMWNSYHQNGGYYIKGSSQALSNAMADVIRENGGDVFLSTRIDKILMERGRAAGVRTQQGKDYRSRFVISNASALQTYLKLVGEENLAPSFVKRLKEMEISCSLFCVYLGLDLDLTLTPLAHQHEIFLNSGYDAEQAYRDGEAGNLDRPFLALGLYSNLDPWFAPAGKSVISLTTLMPYDYRDNWRRDTDYSEYVRIKEAVAYRLIEEAERILPGIRDSIEEMEIGTPRTMEEYTLNDRGAVYGFALTTDQSHIYRLKQKGPVKNLYLAGAWTFPGNGQSACMMSGYATAQMILDRLPRR